MRAHLGVFVIAVAVLSASAARASAQDEVRRLFEAGKLQAAVEQATPDAPTEAQYWKGLAHLKLNQNDAAVEAFRRLQRADDGWRPIGQSAVALIGGDQGGALKAARAAVARDASLAVAHYQLGLALESTGSSPEAAEAFVAATKADPRMAYAHYNAGMHYYKAKRVDRMAVYFENFLKLAPNAPERPAVESIMRTVRGR